MQYLKHRKKSLGDICRSVNSEDDTVFLALGRRTAAPYFKKERDILKEKDFDKMIADLMKQEEKKLGVNSPEFQKKHKEIMNLIEKAGGKGW